MPRQTGTRMFLVLAVLVSACGAEDSPEPEGRAASALQTAVEGTLVVCTEVPRHPFAYERDGKLMGFEVELARAVATNLGLAAEIRHVMGDRILASVARRLCDVGASTIPVDATEDGVEFSAGYLEIQHSLLVRTSEGRYQDLAKLKGRTVGVLSKTVSAEHARSKVVKAGAAVAKFEKVEEMIEALLDDRIQGIVQDRLANAYLARERSETTVVEVFEASHFTYGFAVPKANAKLLDAVNFALADLHGDGTYDKLLQPYL